METGLMPGLVKELRIVGTYLLILTYLLELLPFFFARP